MDKKKTLELLNMLFDAARPDLEEEFSDEAYIIADLMSMVDKPSEVVLRELITEEAIDTIAGTYKIPRNVASRYFKEIPEVMDNMMERIDETIMIEVEDWIMSTDIIKHQGTKEEAYNASNT